MDLKTNRCQEDRKCINVALPQTSKGQMGRQENKQEHPRRTRSKTRTSQHSDKEKAFLFWPYNKKRKLHFDERYPTGLDRKQQKTRPTKNKLSHERKRLDWVEDQR